MARSSDSTFPISIFRDKTFQAREIRRVLVLSTIYLVATTALVGLFYNQVINSLVEGVAPLFFVSEDMHLVNEAVPTLTAILGKWMLAMLLINFVITAALSIYITRKLGHPLLAIKRSLREMGDGNLNVKLRATDESEFGEISHELSMAMQAMREQVSAAKQQIDQAEQLSGENLEPDDDVNLAVRNCKMALDYFQVDDAEPTQSKAA